MFVKQLVRLDSANNSVEYIGIKNISFSVSQEWYNIQLEKTLIINQLYLIEFKQFKSLLNKELKGWYLSEYKEQGKTKLVYMLKL